MRRITAALSLVALAAMASASWGGENERLIHGFEDAQDVRRWEFKKKSSEFVTDHATQGQRCLKLVPGEYMVNTLTKRNFSGFDSLLIDFYVDGTDGVRVGLLIADQDWQDQGRKYWDRHNGSFNLRPGKNTAEIPVEGLYRGEAGSRNNNLKYNIKPDKIIRMDFGFRPMGGGVKAIYIDNMRLVKESKPDGVYAFDFGPPSQPVFPGFTPVSNETVYGQGGKKYGLLKPTNHKNRARDDTFPTRLYQDFIEMTFDNSQFIVDVPNGKTHVWLVYDDCGYWGGEQAKHKWRFIEAEFQEAWRQDRGDDGPPNALFKFEGIEPKPGDNLWDLYMAEIFKPARFSTNVRDGKLNLRFRADNPYGWSNKVAGIIIYPDSKKAEAEKWIAEVEKRNRDEFEKKAAFQGPKPQNLNVPAAARAKGWWLGFPKISDTVTFTDGPGPDGKLARKGCRGTRLNYTFAVRPLRDMDGEVKLTATDLKSGRNSIPASEIDLRYVHHSTKRVFNSISYKILPETVRHLAGSGLKLDKDLTRQFWVTVAVPKDAKPGRYSGTVELRAGRLTEKIPLEVEVVDVQLDEPTFPMGFYGLHIPGTLPEARKKAATRQIFTLLREAGMTTFTGGPNIKFTGLDAAGKPQLDYSACDEFFKIARECGFTGEINSYGGPGMVRGLHSGYTIGPVGRGWEQKTGKSFKELLKIVWTDVKKHAEANDWQPIAYGFTDEPRVLKQARDQLELMRAYRDAVPWVKIGGSYSVHWERNDELSVAIQNIFKTLVWSGLNNHKQADLDKGKELGREVYIYNQGVSRYSFGAYQWAEMHKGVKGRIQWHMLALHGYQFFDLDGREPDTAMINWGRNEVIPTLRLFRCSEGATDFRFADTLWNIAQKKKGTAAGREAIEWLEGVSRKIGVAQRSRPGGFMDDETFRLECLKRIEKLK